MKLTFIEHRFVHAMTHTYRDQVERRLETHSTVLESQKITQKNRFVILLISLLRYFKLIIELIATHFRPAPPTDATFFWEHLPAEVAGRIPFLKWNMPDAKFEGVSYNDKIRSFPDGRFTWRIMLWLLVTILLSLLYKPSLLTPSLIRIVRISLLTFSRAYASAGKTIYLFEIYRIETPFVAAFLKERGIHVHLITASAPLSFDSRVLIGDSLKVCNPYQVDEFAFYRHMGDCELCELWSPETFYQLEARYKGLTFNDRFDTIGIYTSGIMLRNKLGSMNKMFASKSIEHETELLEMVATYANHHPDVHFIIFPHPMERRHYKETGEPPFSKRFEVSNIELDFSNAANSTLQFDRVGLGLTTFSSIGFERVYLGLRTIFYVSDLEYINWDIQSPYHNLFFTEQTAFLSAIDTARKIPHREFINHYFGCLFYPNLWSKQTL